MMGQTIPSTSYMAGSHDQKHLANSPEEALHQTKYICICVWVSMGECGEEGEKREGKRHWVRAPLD